MFRLKAMLLLPLAASLFATAAHAQNTSNARPGTINYFEGQVALNDQPLTSQSAGHTEIAAGQTLSTASGKAEILLTPGVFLRLGDNSAATIVSPNLTKTEIRLDRGTAEIEVDQLFKQNDLLVDQGPAQAKLLKNGLYEFDATASQMRVFDGEAAVSASESAQKWIKVKAHHQLALNGEQAKSTDFDAELAAKQDPLYDWSKLRAEYLGQANLALAERYADNPRVYAGWMWDPALYSYTWLPGNGLFWNSFGYGFYSPYYLYGGGLIYPGYGFGGGYYRPYRGGYGHRGEGFHDRIATTPMTRGFGGGGFHGGGFHGGGGLHGGGGRR